MFITPLDQEPPSPGPGSLLRHPPPIHCKQKGLLVMAQELPKGKTSFVIEPDDEGDPITVTMPLLNYMPPRLMREYQDWVQQQSELAEAHDEWAKKTGKKGPEPDISETPQAVYQFQLRYLKPFVSDGDWKRIWNDVSPGHAQDIFDLLNGREGISEGESSASTDS